MLARLVSSVSWSRSSFTRVSIMAFTGVQGFDNCLKLLQAHWHEIGNNVQTRTRFAAEDTKKHFAFSFLHCPFVLPSSFLLLLLGLRSLPFQGDVRFGCRFFFFFFFVVTG